MVIIMNREEPNLHRELKKSFDYIMQNYHKILMIDN